MKNKKLNIRVGFEMDGSETPEELRELLKLEKDIEDCLHGLVNDAVNIVRNKERN